jgi:MSHA biogenesis protein MshN
MAWTVSENVVELSGEVQVPAKIMRPKMVVPMPAPVILTPAIEAKLDVEEAPVLSLQKETEGPFFEKSEASRTHEEQARIDYHRALESLKIGEIIQAERLLVGTLNQFPTHHASRAELASIYLKENQLDDSERILQEGLKLDENNPDFLRLMAIVYDRREEPDKALSLLVKVKESRRQDKNYVAFLGHIYQQTGRYALARQQYFRLLQTEPSNPIWLLGVSVALDSEGQHDAALEGYHRLAREGNIDPIILQYVQDRINALKG